MNSGQRKHQSQRTLKQQRCFNMTQAEAIKRNQQIENLVKDGWIPMKQWRVEEGERLGISEVGVAMKFTRGAYSNLKRIWFNRRVIYVKA